MGEVCRQPADPRQERFLYRPIEPGAGIRAIALNRQATKAGRMALESVSSPKAEAAVLQRSAPDAGAPARCKQTPGLAQAEFEVLARSLISLLPKSSFF